MRFMLLTALSVWIGFNLLLVAWLRWRARARLRNLREADRISYEIEPHPSMSAVSTPETDRVG
jgi:hypothetical protein